MKHDLELIAGSMIAGAVLWHFLYAKVAADIAALKSLLSGDLATVKADVAAIKTKLGLGVAAAVAPAATALAKAAPPIPRPRGPPPPPPPPPPRGGGGGGGGPLLRRTRHVAIVRRHQAGPDLDL